MTTALGINNPNSLWNRNERRLHLSALPLPRVSEISNLEITIKATVALRDFRYTCGDLYSARFHAIRLGTLRSQLRQLKGIS